MLVSLQPRHVGINHFGDQRLQRDFGSPAEALARFGCIAQPIALDLEIAERKLLLHAEAGAGDTVADLAGDKLDSAQRRSTNEQDPARRMQAKALAIVHR